MEVEIAVLHGDLDAGKRNDAGAFGRIDELRQTRKGIVVGERQDAHAVLFADRDQFRRRKLAVGKGRVHVNFRFACGHGPYEGMRLGRECCSVYPY